MEETKYVTKEGGNKICPVDGAICDRKCGYVAHGTLTHSNCSKCGISSAVHAQTADHAFVKKLNIVVAEDPADANICDGCE